MTYQQRDIWMFVVRTNFVNAKFDNDGSYIWVVDGPKTLGFWNIIGNYGKINKGSLS